MFTCTAAVHSFQNPICAEAFCRSCHLPFRFCVHGRRDAVNSHLLQIFGFVKPYDAIQNHVEFSVLNFGCYKLICRDQ